MRKMSMRKKFIWAACAVAMIALGSPSFAQTRGFGEIGGGIGGIGKGIIVYPPVRIAPIPPPPLTLDPPRVPALPCGQRDIYGHCNSHCCN
jgi:hypothetical protein